MDEISQLGVLNLLDMSELTSVSLSRLWHIPQQLTPLSHFNCCIKKWNPCEPHTEKQKGVKTNAFPPHSNTHACPPTHTALSPTLPRANVLSNTHAHTHRHTHTSVQIHTLKFSSKQSLVEREGDVCKGRVWTVAVTALPHPSYTTMNKWSHDIRCFHQSSHCSDSKSLKDLSLHSVLITSEFSQLPQWGSPYVCGQQLHSGNRRDSRVYRSNGEWHRTGCHSGSQSQWGPLSSGKKNSGSFSCFYQEFDLHQKKPVLLLPLVLCCWKNPPLPLLQPRLDQNLQLLNPGRCS